VLLSKHEVLNSISSITKKNKKTKQNSLEKQARKILKCHKQSLKGDSGGSSEDQMLARHQWLMPALLATLEAQSGRSWFEASPG
jgi:hypothetical protein